MKSNSKKNTRSFRNKHKKNVSLDKIFDKWTTFYAKSHAPLNKENQAFYSLLWYIVWR
jgi:hypothetical protein